MLFDKVSIQEYFINLFKFEVEYEADNPNYRCLRGLIHVTNATKIFLWLELLAIPMYLLFLFPYSLLWIIQHVLLIVATLYAVKKGKQRWMWPLIIYATIQFGVWIMITAVKLFIGIFNTDYFLELYGQGHHEDMFVRYGIVILVKLIVLTFGALLFWRLTVLHATRKYFEAKEDGAVELTNPELATGLEKLMKPL